MRTFPDSIPDKYLQHRFQGNQSSTVSDKVQLLALASLPATFLDELNGNTDSLHQKDKDEDKNSQKCRTCTA